ncbi:MAG: radical SAM family heme chaperone HemW [Bacteroidales bacterium]|nr:radical SAM family heme chaperone HemW [Bacteroidales bacterium]
MAGIYIHIPFCKSKCAYCNFFSVVNGKQRADFLDALKKEAVIRKSYINEEVETVYFGGGTPSILKPDEMQSVLDVLYKNFNISGDAEITLEANPDTVSKELLKDFNTIGINRLSVGIQSFHDDDLQYLSRKHDSKHALQVLDWANETGFQEVTMDLIYGIPTLTEEKWAANLDIFFSKGINHLSAYALTIEPKTALGQRISRGVAAPVDEDAMIRHYEMLVERAENEGFEHYEISNFAKPGHHSRHNRSYWIGVKYLGLGPSAHSFDGASRQWNTASVTEYCKLINEFPNSLKMNWFEKEVLTSDDRYNEYVMTSLRTRWGCDAGVISRNFGEKYRIYFEKNIVPYLRDGRLVRKGSCYALTENGMLFADGIAAELFFN